MSGGGNLDSVDSRERENLVINEVRREMTDAMAEKRFGETVFRVVFADGRAKLLEITGKTSYKFE